MTILAVFLAYAVGSVPTGLWLGLKFRGLDIREHGSRNIGATNTLRVLGTKMGIIALLCDVGKGLVAVLVVARLSGWEHAPLACGLAAIVGHSASLFLKFRGGKGVATSAGVFLGLCWLPTLIAVAAFLAVAVPTRMVSAGSVCAAVALGVSIYALPNPWPLRVVVTLVAMLVIVKHRSNLRRIIKGEESKLSFGKRVEGLDEGVQ